MGRLWIRDIVLEFEGRGGTLTVRPGPKGQMLHTTFSVTKGIGATPNSATITIANLAQENRLKIKREFDRVRLEAGYVGAGNRGIIFTGTVRDVTHKREGADIVTTVDCGDGDKGYREGVISRTFPAGTKPADVVEAIRAEMPDVARGVIHEAVSRLPPFPRPVTMCGPCRSELSKIGRTFGLYWSIQDGALEIVPGDGFVDDVTVISQQTGMIGVPEITDNGVRVDCLLNPALRIGRVVEVRSETLAMNGEEGRFRISALSFEGGSDAQDGFYARVTGEKIDGGKVDEGRD